MPKSPLNSTVLLGRQGASEAWQLVKRTPSAAIASMCGLVGRWQP
jgi:hypothetical protein